MAKLDCELPTIAAGKSRSKTYYNIPAVFDIETSSFLVDGVKQSCMYAWVFGIGGNCTVGRTWEEFKSLITEVELKLELSNKRLLTVYVHNLAYEFQFIRNQFEWKEVYALDTRKPVYAQTTHGILFKCSYLLSGYSLALVGKNLTKYKVEKRVGDLDYRLVRHTETPLSAREWGYILNDGLVVMAYIQEQIERLGTINKIPNTSTGFVRAYTRSKCFEDKKVAQRYREMIKTLRLTPDTYLLLKRAFSGGFTHANYHFANCQIQDVHSYDFTSSYPAVMLSERFPMTSPKYAVIETESQLEFALEKLACVFDVTFDNIISSVDYDNYISISRCITYKQAICNNGRVIEAESLTMTVTEIDFKLIRQMYTFDSFRISNFHYMYKGFLPKPMIQAILELYKNKTELKGVEGMESEYLVSKGMLNSLYGMCVTDICRDNDKYVGNTWICETADISQCIEKYNKEYNRFLFYAWGVWVTAYARQNLFRGIAEFNNDYIYSDTDSIKVLHPEKHQDFFTEYNTEIISKVYNTLDHYGIPREYATPKTIKGKEKPIGVWDYEGKYERFKTLGAKRYMYTQNDELHITIAGVGKKAGAEYLKHRYKTLDNIFANFKDGIEFPAEYEVDDVILKGAGKMTHTYIDGAMDGVVTDYLGNTAEYHELSGVYMENAAYNLSLEQYYKELIQGDKEI